MERYNPHTGCGGTVRGLVQLERITFRAVSLLYKLLFFLSALNLILSLRIVPNKGSLISKISHVFS